jgi:hypothetical protein
VNTQKESAGPTHGDFLDQMKASFFAPGVCHLDISHAACCHWIRMKYISPTHVYATLETAQRIFLQQVTRG